VLYLAWKLLGSSNHLGLDMLNSYGAMVLWPFSNRKYGWGLLLIFDPVLFVLTLCIYVNNTSNLIVSIICMSLIMLYFLFRAYMLKWAASQVQLRFRHLGIHSIVVLPSIMRLFHWEFIIYTKTSVFTGFIDIITKKLSIRGCLKKTESWIEEAVMSTPLGKFFSEFTQHFHINSKKMGDNYYITMIDLRYFGKNSYLHHATAVLNSNLQMMQCIFHPYHQNRNVKILAEY
jgi:inner membrane protein